MVQHAGVKMKRFLGVPWELENSIFFQYPIEGIYKKTNPRNLAQVF
jgi:hypothetical protein